jgi:hypothetical protein
MKKQLLFLTFLLYATILLSQNIKGIVIDKNTEEPVIGAHIYFNENDIITVSDVLGKFSFSASKNSVNKSFFVSHINYGVREVVINDSSDIYEVFFSEKREMLESVVISQKQKLKKEIKFTRLSSMQKGLYSFATVLVDNKIYVFGGESSSGIDLKKRGFSELQGSSEAEIMKVLSRRNPSSFLNIHKDLYIYNLEKETWTKSDIKFRKRANHTAVFLNGKIYLIGGKTFSRTKTRELLDDKIEIFDIKKNTIQIDHTNPHQTVDLETLIYNDKIITIGGSTKVKDNGVKTYLDKVHLYNSETGVWYKIANLPDPKETSGVLMNDEILLFGGNSNRALSTITSLNLKSGKWTEEGLLSRKFIKPAITKHKELVFIFENSILCTYNRITKEVNEYRIDIPIYGSKMYYKKGKLYVLGGYYKDDFSLSPSSNVYSIDVKEFDTTRIIKSL